MIALDASALRAILSGEPEARWFARMIAENDCLVGAPTRLEALLAARATGETAQVVALEALFHWRNVETVALGAAHLAAAEAAAAQMQALPGSLVERLHRLEGQRNGVAAIPDRRLNIGPCLSYAVARVAAVPLLFKDEALARTDIEPAWRP